MKLFPCSGEKEFGQVGLRARGRSAAATAGVADFAANKEPLARLQATGESSTGVKIASELEIGGMQRKWNSAPSSACSTDPEASDFLAESDQRRLEGIALAHARRKLVQMWKKGPLSMRGEAIRSLGSKRDENESAASLASLTRWRKGWARRPKRGKKYGESCKEVMREGFEKNS